VPGPSREVDVTNPWNEEEPYSISGMWFASEECVRAINEKITGDPGRHWLDYALATYLAPALGLVASPRRRTEYRCLVLGATEGFVETSLWEHGFRGDILVTDIADRALARSEAATTGRGISNVSYVQADLNEARFEGPFDYVVARGTLHHVERLEGCLVMVRDCLADGGLVLMAEFEGPFRFQVSDLQVRWINAALNAVPKALRPFPASAEGVSPPSLDDAARIHYVRASEADVAAYDPSEALSGPALKRLVPELFEIVERTGYGGTLLSYMAGHFDFDRTNDDEFARTWVRVLLAIEDAAISTGILDHEFVFTVARKRSTAS
jgi:SAM-dependent methyltransferase